MDVNDVERLQLKEGNLQQPLMDAFKVKHINVGGKKKKRLHIYIHHISSYLAHVKLQTSHVPLNGFDLLRKDRDGTIIY